MFRSKLFYVLTALYSLQIIAQTGYRWPLDPPLIVSGNYGEIRPFHFHAGLDFSTGGKTGKPVYAVADGYVSRVKVSAYGYGKAIYVTHGDGNVTLYAHLSKFGANIARAVEEQQYARASFEVDFELPRNQITVKSGEVIGLSGNSGSSGGPHLHFEIRDEKSETPLNPLKRYVMPDKVPPVVTGLAFYDLSDTLHPRLLRTVKVRLDHGKLTPEMSWFTFDASVVGVAFSGYDQVAAIGGKNNIYSVKLTLENKTIYEHALDGISFADNRYSDEMSVMHLRKMYQKCFLPTLYPAAMYRHHSEKGRVVFNDDKHKELLLEFADEAGNVVTLKIHLRSTRPGGYDAHKNSQTNATGDCMKSFSLTQNNVKLEIPAYGIYQQATFTLGYSQAVRKILILPEVKLRLAATVSFLLPPAFRVAPGKAVVVASHGVYVPGISNDSAIITVKGLGKFTLMADSVKPVISRVVSTRRMTVPANQVIVKIKDNLSGIGKYAIFIDEKWVAAEYDGKSGKLSWFRNDLKEKPKVRVRVEVTDRCGNFSKMEFDHFIKR